MIRNCRRQSFPALLNNFENIISTFNNCSDSEEFAFLVGEYFEINGRSSELLQYAISAEVQATDRPWDLFRAESFITRLFFMQFFNDVGKKYLHHILFPLIHETMLLEKSLEASLELITNTFEKINEMLDRLVGSTDMCPMFLREGFSFLYQKVQEKFPENTVIIGAIIFLRFFGPTIVFPGKYLLDKTIKLTPVQQGNMIAVSKILQLLANNSQGIESKPYQQITNEFVVSHQFKIQQFITNIVEMPIVNHVISSPESTEQRQRRLIKCLSQIVGDGMCTVEAPTAASVKEHMLREYQSKGDYVVLKQSKSTGYTVFLKEELGICTFKNVARYPCSVFTLFETIKSFPQNSRRDPRVTFIECVQEIDEHTVIWYVQIALPWPFGKRDFVIQRILHFDENFCYMYFYSVVHPSKPPQKGFVRINIQINGTVIEPDSRDPNKCLYTNINLTDIRGSMTAWFMKRGSKHFIKYLKNVANSLEMEKQSHP